MRGFGQERLPTGRTNQGALDARRRWEIRVAPLRQKLIHVLASIVAIDLAIAGVVIDARSGSASASSTVALRTPVTANGRVLPTGVGHILGAATFKQRRRPGGTTGTTAASGSSQVASGLPAGSPSSGRSTVEIS